MAFKIMNGLDLQAQRIQNVSDPSSNQDAATKAYVDATAAGLTWKAAVRVASTGNVTITAPGTAIDGVTLAAGDRVLLKNETVANTNGIYVFATSATAMTRATDSDSPAELHEGAVCMVEEGTANADTAWIQNTSGTIVVGTTSLTYVQFGAGGSSYSAGNGIGISGGVISATAYTGISVTGSGIAIDTSVVPRIYKATVTGSTSITVTHNLGTYDVHVQVWDAVGAGANAVICDITAATTNTVTLGFASAPTNFRCIVIG